MIRLIQSFNPHSDEKVRAVNPKLHYRQEHLFSLTDEKEHLISPAYRLQNI